MPLDRLFTWMNAPPATVTDVRTKQRLQFIEGQNYLYVLYSLNIPRCRTFVIYYYIINRGTVSAQTLKSPGDNNTEEKKIIIWNQQFQYFAINHSNMPSHTDQSN